MFRSRTALGASVEGGMKESADIVKIFGMDSRIPLIAGVLRPTNP